MYSPELLVLTMACVLLYFVMVVWKAMTYWKVRGIKHFKPWPIVGNFARVLKLQKHLTYYYDEVYKAFPEERMVGIYELLTPTLVLRHPNLIEQVLVREFSTYPDHGDFIFEPNSINYNSLFSITGERWRALRNKLLTTFTTAKMRAIFPELSKSCQILVESNPKRLNKELFHRFAVKSFMNSMFGTEIRQCGEEELMNNCRKMFEPTVSRIYQQVLLTYLPKLANFLHLTFMPKYLDNYFKSLMTTILDQREKINLDRNDYAQVLCDMRKSGKMNVYNRDNSKIEKTFDVCNDLAIAQAFFFFFAGLDTTTLLMIHVAFQLSLDKECQEKARQEVRKILKKYGGYSWEAVRDMKYLDKCVQETLRLHPSIQFIVRISDRDTELDGIKIKKGTRIIVPVHSLHMDPKNFPNPEVFDPERFNELPKKFTHLPFSDGPRVCIGKRFSTMETMTIIAHLLNNFEFSLSPSTKLPLVYEPKSLFHNPILKNEISVILNKIS